MNALNAFIRRMAVLSVLWAFCEMLLPEGRQRRAVRLTVSLMMAAALLSSVTALLPASAERVQESFALFRQAEGSAAADRLALQAAAREAEAFLVRLAEKAGYDAQGSVWLCTNGALYQAEVRVSPNKGQTLLLSTGQLRQKIAQALQVEEDRITVSQTVGAEGA